MRAGSERLVHRLMIAAAMLSLLSGGIHIWLGPAHFEEWWGYGIFFLMVGAGQLLFAIALVGWRHPLHAFPRRWMLAIGILANAALVAFYLFTRTVGVPAGPEAGEVEPVRLVDLVAKTAESILVILLIALAVFRKIARAGSPRAGRFPGTAQPR